MTSVRQFTIPSQLNAAELDLVSKAAERLEKSLATRNTTRGLTRDEILSTLQVIEFSACQEDWERVVNLSSNALIAGCGENATLSLYRSWIEGLRFSHDVSGLQALAKHLINTERESREHLSLALLAITYAGRRNYATALYNELEKKHSANLYVLEAKGVYLAEGLETSRRRDGIRLLRKVAHTRTSCYFDKLNYLLSSLDVGASNYASHAAKTLFNEYPLSPEPLWIGAGIAMQEERWNDAIAFLSKIFLVNNNNTEACLALAQCYEKMGDLIAADTLLRENSHLFEASDYDYSVSMGAIQRSLFARYQNPAYRSEAVKHYANALHTAKRLQLPDAQLHIALYDLKAGIGEERFSETKHSDPRYWVVATDNTSAHNFLTQESFLIHCPSSLAKDDVIFFARYSPDKTSLFYEGIFKVQSPVVPDNYLKCMARIGDGKFFESPIPSKMDNEYETKEDAFGCQNFSLYGEACFYSIGEAVAEKIIDRAERHSKGLRDRGRNVG